MPLAVVDAVGLAQTDAGFCLQPSLSRYARIVTHDVYVRVIPLREWHEHEEPEMPKFDVSNWPLALTTGCVTVFPPADTDRGRSDLGLSQ